MSRIAVAVSLPGLSPPGVSVTNEQRSGCFELNLVRVEFEVVMLGQAI